MVDTTVRFHSCDVHAIGHIVLHSEMLTFNSVFVFCILCIIVKICRSAMQTFQVEQIFYNKVVLDNLLAEYGHSTSAQCSVVCQQESCKCFGFNSITQICRIHAFCKPENTLVEESGWKYYRSRAGSKDIFSCIYFSLNKTCKTLFLYGS